MRPKFQWPTHFFLSFPPADDAAPLAALINDKAEELQALSEHGKAMARSAVIFRINQPLSEHVQGCRLDDRVRQRLEAGKEHGSEAVEGWLPASYTTLRAHQNVKDLLGRLLP